MVLVLDNYDSFTHNLARYFMELGQVVNVVRNDEITIDEIEALAPDHIVLSPGPCTPNESGICLAVVSHFAGKIPILGVCLGHQAIGQVFGASVIRSDKPVHGKVSRIVHQDSQLFKDVPQAFNATRYHSLVIDEKTLPPEFKVTAWDLADGVKQYVMAIEHQSLPIMGIQFHPESVMTEHGHAMLANFLGLEIGSLNSLPVEMEFNHENTD